MTNEEWMEALHKKLKEFHSVEGWKNKNPDQIGN